MRTRTTLLVLAAFVAASIQASAGGDRHAPAPKKNRQVRLIRGKRAPARVSKAQTRRWRRAAAKKTYRTLNAPIAKKYPRLRFVLEDPRKFFRTMESRFNAQKKRAPKNPYGFDYSEVGIPVLGDMKQDIETQIDFLKGQLGLRGRDGKKGKKIRFLSKRRARDMHLAIEYMERLRVEVLGYLKNRSVTYKELYEVGYFFSRAIGHFQKGDLPLLDRLLLPIDRVLEGYEQFPMERELKLYKNREFSVYQKEAPVKGFMQVSKNFEKAFANPKRLDSLIVPTNQDLQRDVFMRLIEHNIYLVGITPTPIAADGFVRPGGDFWLHDIRHSSAMFGKQHKYQKRNRIGRRGMRKVRSQMDQWRVELEASMKTIDDPKLRNAIEFFMFNHHHDRGYPLVPSSYLKKRIEPVPYLLYGMLRISGQEKSLGFRRPVRNLNKAYRWLQDFWLSRLPEERAMLAEAAQPVR